MASNINKAIVIELLIMRRYTRVIIVAPLKQSWQLSRMFLKGIRTLYRKVGYTPQNKDYQVTVPAITSKVWNQRWNQRKRDGNNDNQIAILLPSNIM